MCRLRDTEGNICRQKGAGLRGISVSNRETRKDPALGDSGRLHGFSFQAITEDEEALQISDASKRANAGHYRLHRISAMRSAACPSHRGGMTPFLAFPSKTFFSSAVNLLLSSPTRMFVPNVTVIGR